MKTCVILLIGLMACTSAPSLKPIHFISERDCWYQTADKMDWRCQVDLDKHAYDYAIKNSVEATYDDELKTTCWKYKAGEGVWEARCLEEQLEGFKRQGCKFSRFRPGVVAVACP